MNQLIVIINKSVNKKSKKVARQVLFFYWCGVGKCNIKIFSIGGITVKDYEIKVLDEDDRIFIKNLSSLGMSRNVAATMAFLMNVEEASAREIEISTGLRQPEVSLKNKVHAHRSLVRVHSKRTWERTSYKDLFSAAPVDEIISYYENKIYKESQATISAIKKLKVICKKVPFTLSS